MRMNRRSVLFVLGTTVLLGGLLIGSGAFSQVQADRTVSVSTSGDASAALGLNVNDAADHAGVNATNADDGAIQLSFSNVNDNATVYYDDVLNVTNNDNAEITVTAYSNHNAVEVYNGSYSSAPDFGTDTQTDLGTLSGSPTNETKSLGIALNTSDNSLEGGDPSITIVAERP